MFDHDAYWTDQRVDDADFDLAMNDLFEVLEKMPAESKKEAFDTVGRSLFHDRTTKHPYDK